MKTNFFTSRGKNPEEKGKGMTGKCRWVIGVIAVLFLGTGNIMAATYYARAAGAWQGGAIWSTSPTGAGATATITTNDVVIIEGFAVTTTNAATVAGTVYIDNGGSLTISSVANSTTTWSVDFTNLLIGTRPASSGSTASFTTATGSVTLNNSGRRIRIGSLTLGNCEQKGTPSFTIATNPDRNSACERVEVSITNRAMFHGAYTVPESGNCWSSMNPSFNDNTPVCPPAITVTGTPLAPFITCPTSFSKEQVINVSALYLTHPVIIEDDPTGIYEFSINKTSGYQSPLSLGTTGTLVSTPVYVRLKTALSTSLGNDFSRTIQVRTTGGVDKDFSVTGSVIVGSGLSASVSTIAVDCYYQDPQKFIETKSFEVTGACLNSNISLTVAPQSPVRYQISTTAPDANDFGSSATLPPGGGPVYVRLIEGFAIGTLPNGTITIESQGVSSTSVTVTGTVNPRPGGKSFWISVVTTDASWADGPWSTASCAGTTTTERPGRFDEVIVCTSGTPAQNSTLTIDVDHAICGSISTSWTNNGQDNLLTIPSGKKLEVFGNMNYITATAATGNTSQRNLTVAGTLIVHGDFNMENSHTTTGATPTLTLNGGGTIEVSKNFNLAYARFGGTALGCNLAGTGGTIKVGENFTYGIAPNGGWTITTANLTLELTGCGQAIKLGRAITVGTLRQSKAPCATRYDVTGMTATNRINFTTYDQNCNPVVLAGNTNSPQDGWLTGFNATATTNWATCSASSTCPGRINAPSISTVTIGVQGGINTICQGTSETRTLTATLGSGSSSSYKWYKNGAILQTTTTNTLSGMTAGTYYVIAADANGCETRSATPDLVITAIPCGPVITATTCATTGNNNIEIFTDALTGNIELGSFTLTGSNLTGVSYVVITPPTTGDQNMIDLVDASTSQSFWSSAAGAAPAGWKIPAVNLAKDVKVVLKNNASVDNVSATFTTSNIDIYDSDNAVIGGTKTLSLCTSTYKATVRKLIADLDCTEGPFLLTSFGGLDSGSKDITVTLGNLDNDVTISLTNTDGSFALKAISNCTVEGGEITLTADGTYKFGIYLVGGTAPDPLPSTGLTIKLDNSSKELLGSCVFNSRYIPDPNITIDCESAETFVSVAGESTVVTQTFDVTGYVDFEADGGWDEGNIDFAITFTNDHLTEIPFTYTTQAIAIDGDGIITGKITVSFDASDLVAEEDPTANLKIKVTDGTNELESDLCYFTSQVLAFTVDFDIDAVDYCIGQKIMLTADVTGTGNFSYTYTIEEAVVGVIDSETSSNSYEFTVPAGITGDLTFKVMVSNGTSKFNVTKEITGISKANDGCPEITFSGATDVPFCPGETSVTIDAEPSEYLYSGDYTITYKWEKVGTAGFLPQEIDNTLVVTPPTTVDNTQKYKITAYANGKKLEFSEIYTLKSNISMMKPLPPVLVSDKAKDCPGEDITIELDPAHLALADYLPGELTAYRWYLNSDDEYEQGTDTYIQTLEEDATYLVKARVKNVCGTWSEISTSALKVETDDTCTEEDGCGPVISVTFAGIAAMDVVSNCTDCSPYFSTPLAQATNLFATDGTATGHRLYSGTTGAWYSNGTAMALTNFLTASTRCFTLLSNSGATLSNATVFTLKHPDLDMNYSYRINFRHRGIGIGTVSGSYNFAGESIPFGVNESSWSGQTFTLTYEDAALKTLLKTTGLNLTTTIANADAVRLAFDNISITPICPPTFKIAPNQATGDCSTTQLELIATKGYDLSKATIQWQMKSLTAGTGYGNITLDPIENGVIVDNVTGKTTKIIYDISGYLTENVGNLMFRPLVTGEGYPAVDNIESKIFACQSVEILSDPVVCGGLNSTLTTKTIPETSAASYIYKWQQRVPGGSWEIIDDKSLSTYLVEEPGEYRVAVKITTAGAPWSLWSDVVEILPIRNLDWIGSGGTIADDWNDPDNWEDQATGNPPTSAPTKCDNVYLDQTLATVYPTLEEGAVCKTINFGINTAVGKVHLLGYDNATAALNIKTTPFATPVGSYPFWYMLASPFKGMTTLNFSKSSTHLSFARYFVADKNGLASWTDPLAGGYSLDAGQGFVYRAATIGASAVDLKLSFSGNLFADEWDGDSYTLTPKLFAGVAGKTDPENPNSAYENVGGYAIVGNPFMSHLDIAEFVNVNFTDNSVIGENFIKIYDSYARGFKSFSGSAGDDNTHVATFQSFIVKLPAGVGISGLELEITPEMLGAVTEGSALRGLNVSEDVLRIRASQDGYTSIDAVVIAKDGASNLFDPKEDAVKLFSAEAPLEVYTLVEDKACDINSINRNALNELMIPINIKSTKAGTITLEINGAIGFSAADEIYLYDAISKARISLLEKEIFFITKEDAENIEGRFFLQFIKETIETPEPTDINELAGKLYIGTQQGNIVVEARNEQILQVIVYDVAGRKVIDAGNINSNAYSAKLQDGAAYLVKVVTDQQVKTGKVIIK